MVLNLQKDIEYESRQIHKKENEQLQQLADGATIKLQSLQNKETSLKKAIKTIKEAQDGGDSQNYGQGRFPDVDVEYADQSDFDVDDSDYMGAEDNYFDLKVKQAVFNPQVL